MKKEKVHLRTFLLCVMMVAASSTAWAATVPQLLNYQGGLNDSAGTPVNGTKSMIFSLYTSATDTIIPPLWTETQSVTVMNGAFSVVLGTVNVLPTSVFDNNGLWLGITVSGDSEMTPRQQITSVGYAMRANIADSVGTFPTVTAISQIVSTVPTGTAPLQVASTTTVTNLSADLLDGLDSSAFQRKAGKVAVVAKSGGDFADPVAAMQSISSWCGVPSSENPCMVKIMPGVYTLGTNSLVMKDYVDIEGSGENTTRIAAAISTSGNVPSQAAVQGANNAELRLLTVENAGGSGTQTAAIVNNGVSTRITHVTAIVSGGAGHGYAIYTYGASALRMTDVTANASGGVYNFGIASRNSSLAMARVTATAIGGDENYGMSSFSCSLTMADVIASASGGAFGNYGIYNNGSSGTLTNVAVSGWGGAWSFGLYDQSSSLLLSGVTATASGGTNENYGVFNSASSPTMLNITATASGGDSTTAGVFNDGSSPVMMNVYAAGSGGATNNYGVYNNGPSSPLMTNVTATSSGGAASYGIVSSTTCTATMNNVTASATGGTSNIGIFSQDSSPAISGSRATASGGSESYGVYVNSSAVKIDSSVLAGETNTIRTNSGTTLVGSSRLEGGAVSAGSGTVTCAGVYDKNYAFYASTCP